mmetsp:Transcript_7853/g.14915  ORF Transcript_7853/g.14915 Transcript_7853/m.14915 type:complete len:100 (+) Transcript_7853:123-422(+)
MTIPITVDMLVCRRAPVVGISLQFAVASVCALLGHPQDAAARAADALGACRFQTEESPSTAYSTTLNQEPERFALPDVRLGSWTAKQSNLSNPLLMKLG